MDRSKGPINNIKLLLELHHTSVKQSYDEHIWHGFYVSYRQVIAIKEEDVKCMFSWASYIQVTAIKEEDVKCMFSWASSKFHWTFSLIFLVMCAADGKTDFCIL